MSQLAPRAKYPSAKFDTIGKRFKGTVAEPTQDRQARKYGSTELAFWPDGNPVMQTRIVLEQEDGSKVAVYAQGNLAKAVTKALVDAEAPDIEVGGTLEVWWDANDPESKNPANPRKLYGAIWTPPADTEWDPADID